MCVLKFDLFMQYSFGCNSTVCVMVPYFSCSVQCSYCSFLPEDAVKTVLKGCNNTD
jgi:hypothetical protein